MVLWSYESRRAILLVMEANLKAQRELFLSRGDGIEVHPDTAGLPSGEAAICPICSKPATKEAFKKFSDRYFRCSPCDFVFIFPRPSLSELDEHYDQYGHDYYTNPRTIDYFFAPHKVEREVRFLLQVAPKGRLLDVGCSMGAFVKAALEQGFEATGIDICEPATEVGRAKGLPIACAELFSFEPGTPFDVITMWATLEHVPDPNAFLQRIHQLLRPGGIFIASVPNFSGLAQRILGPKDRYVCRDHLNYWTAGALIRYFARSGFEPISWVTFAFNPLTLLGDLRSRKNQIECREVIQIQTTVHMLKNSPLLHLHRFAERFLNLFRAGDVIAVAGRKQEQPASHPPNPAPFPGLR